MALTSGKIKLSENSQTFTHVFKIEIHCPHCGIVITAWQCECHNCKYVLNNVSTQ